MQPPHPIRNLHDLSRTPSLSRLPTHREDWTLDKTTRHSSNFDNHSEPPTYIRTTNGSQTLITTVPTLQKSLKIPLILNHSQEYHVLLIGGKKRQWGSTECFGKLKEKNNKMETKTSGILQYVLLEFAARA